MSVCAHFFPFFFFEKKEPRPLCGAVRKADAFFSEGKKRA
jgi:hypothetical protein